jgi:uncharacterized membrane protein YagU involved in acid resistance
MSSQMSSQMPSQALRRSVLIIVAAGIIAGTTNLVAAGAIFGGTMTHGFQMIASGLLGEQAFSGGLNAAMLGAVLHFAISIAAAGLYLWAALRHDALTRHWLVGGVLFGVLVYLVMNLVVVPLSHAANPDFSLSMIVKELLAHTVMFGVPIAGIVRAFVRQGWDTAPGTE